jgi:glycosyltransferase involved in cell wall biosynthesis
MPHFDVKAIELANYQRLYRWERQDSDFVVHTLKNGVWEDQIQWQVALELWKKLSALQPEIVLVPGYASLPALCAAIWGRTHRAMTILMTESNFDDHRRHPLSEAVKRTIVRFLFNGGIAGGRRSTSYLERLGMPSRRIGRAYDVVDNQYFASHAAQCRRQAIESGNGYKSPYFLYVGRLAPEKNLCTLLDAFGLYRDSGGIWPLVIVGDGPLNGALRDQANAHLRSGAVVFTGQKNIHELPSIYAFAGCFVLASAREPWGLVVNEAMASGLPVIVSSRCGCVDDLVDDGSNGFIIDSSSAPSIAQALVRMSKLSGEERARMGERSQRIISDYSPDRWASEVRRISSIE